MVAHLSIDYRRQKFVATYVLPARLGRDLRPRCSPGASLAPAKNALRQWLRLHVLAPEELEMPSAAVSLLWREFTSSSDFDHFSSHAYGHLANRKPDNRRLKRRPDFTNTDGLALTFAMACVDQGLDVPHPSRLPMLFDVDGALGIDGGQRKSSSRARFVEHRAASACAHAFTKTTRDGHSTDTHGRLVATQTTGV